MNYAVDLALFAVLGLSVFLAARKGFFPTLFDLGAKIIALIGARLLSVYLAPMLYGQYLEPGIKTAIVNRLGNAVNYDVADSVETALNSIPESLAGLMSFIGFEKKELIAQAKQASLTGESLVSWLMEHIVEPAVTAVSRIILFAVISAVLLIILKIVLGLIAKGIEDMPVLKQADKILGSVLGVLRGAIIVLVAVFVLTFISSVTKSEGFIEAVSQSKIVGMTEGLISSVSGYIK